MYKWYTVVGVVGGHRPFLLGVVSIGLVNELNLIIKRFETRFRHTINQKRRRLRALQFINKLLYCTGLNHIYIVHHAPVYPT